MVIFLLVVIVVIPSVAVSIVALLLASLLTSVTAISLAASVTSVSSVTTSVIVVIVSAALPIVSFAVLVFFALALIALGLPLGFPLLFPPAPFLLVRVVLLSCLVAVPLERLLVEEEVDLHALVSIWQMALPLDLNHVVEGAGFLPLIYLKHNANLVLALASMIANWSHIYPLRSKTRQELHGLSFALTMVVVLALLVVPLLLIPLVSLEQVDLKAEGRLFLLDGFHEERGIVLVVLAVVRFRVDLRCVEALMLLLVSIEVVAPLIVAIPPVVIATAAFTIAALSSITVVVAVIVAASSGASARLPLVAVWRIGWPVVLLIIINCVSSVRSFAVTILTSISSIICGIVLCRSLILVSNGLLSCFGRCDCLGS